MFHILIVIHAWLIKYKNFFLALLIYILLGLLVTCVTK